MEAVECGAASLAMVMAHHGAWIPLEKLRVECGVTRDGTNASNILKAARRFGLSAKGFRKSPDKLMALPVPSIIHWNFNHFLVFEGIKSGYAYLNDPATGQRRIDLEELGEYFTGVVLAFEVGEDFVQQGGPNRGITSLKRYLKGAHAALVLVLLASLAMVIPGIAIAGFAKIFVDQVLVDGRSDWLVPLMLAMGFTALLRGGLTALQQGILLRVETYLSVKMSSGFMWHLLKLPTEFFGQRHVGDLSDRMAANDRVATLISGELATNFLNMMTVVFYLIAIAIFDPIMALVAVCLAIVNAGVLGLVSRGRQDASRSLLMSQGKLGSVTVSSIRSAESIKAAGLENDSFAKFGGHQALMLEEQRKLGTSGAVLVALPVFTNLLTTAGILGIGGLRVIDGALSLGAIIAIQSLASHFSTPIVRLVALGANFQKINGDLARLEDVSRYEVSAPRGPKEGETWDGPPALNGHLQVKDLTFGFNPIDPPLIKGLSLDIQPGRRVALVGGSGSGKSTLGRLIAGILEPKEGDLLLDGRPYNDIPPEVFAASVAYVDQDIFLFSGSIRENLTLWNETVPQEMLTHALKDASIHDDVMAREGRYEAMVEEGGINFSGGQCQRLEIARALITEPRVLILDEATAALDPIIEKVIDDNIRRRGCSCLIIAHRLSTIRDCDEIIVLSKGEIVERGSHEELLAHDGEYKRLVGSESH
jgi:NHLM bacteriocin system ABC transporter peptidase/ATP-binding protein